MSPLTPKLLLSAALGLIYGLLSYFILMDLPYAGRWALICGLTAFALLLLFMLLNDSRMARRYARAEKLLPGTPHFRVGANIRQDGKVNSVNVYLCQDEMVLLNVHKRTPVLTRIPREALRRAELEMPVQLNIETADGLTLSLLSPYMEELVSRLRRQGWCITHLEP